MERSKTASEEELRALLTAAKAQNDDASFEELAKELEKLASQEENKVETTQFDQPVDESEAF